MNYAIPFFLAYLGKKLLYLAIGYDYNIFKDTFDLAKLVIDLGIFALLWFLGIVLYNKFVKKPKPAE